MKLKKIASLALAGVMAVSMLAGCATKGSDNTDNTDNTVTTDVVAAVNDTQEVVTFTSSSKVADVLQKAYKADGTGLTVDKIETYLSDWADIKSEGATGIVNSVVQAGSFGAGFVTEDLQYSLISNDEDKVEKLDGAAFTFVQVKKYTNYPNESVLMNVLGSEAKNDLDQLDENSYIAKNAKPDTKYLGYTYDGTINMLTVPNADGTTDYYVVTVITQNVAEKTL